MVQGEQIREPACSKALRIALPNTGLKLLQQRCWSRAEKGHIFRPIFRDGHFEGFCSGTFGVNELIGDLASEDLNNGYWLIIEDESSSCYPRRRRKTQKLIGVKHHSIVAEFTGAWGCV